MALFKPEKKRIKPKGKWSVTLDTQMCKDCKFCIQVCPVEVFEQAKEPNRMGWFPIRVAHEENCVGCMLCFQYCPDFVINVAKVS